MHIMQVLSGMGVNGAVLQCLTLTRALAARGHDITLVCRPGAWCSTQPFDSRVRLVPCNMRRWPLTDLRSMAKLVRREKIDVIHTHQSRAHFFGVLLRWLSKAPCIATAHARHLQPYWRFNDFVIANSEATYDFQRRWNFVPEDRIRVVHYLVDLEQFERASTSERDRVRQSWNVDDGILLAGIVGDLIPRKGQLYAIRAWANVRRALPHAKLVIVGEEKDATYVQLLRAEADKLQLNEHIVWAGYRTDIPAVMQALDICVSAALEEALGLTIPEAMAASRPVVATSVGGVPENIREGLTGLLVPPADPRSLGEAIIRLLSNEEWRQESGRRAQRYIREKYDPQRPLEEIEQIYRLVAGEVRCQVQAA